MASSHGPGGTGEQGGAERIRQFSRNAPEWVEMRPDSGRRVEGVGAHPEGVGLEKAST